MAASMGRRVDDTPRRARRRAQRIDVAQARAALKVVMPLARQIGTWQADAVRLVAMGERLSVVGTHDPGVEADVRTLKTLVHAGRQSLLDRVSTLPPEIATHGRLIDTARALNSILRSLDRAEALVGLGPRGRSPAWGPGGRA